MSDDLAGTDRQTRFSRPSGKEMDGVPISAGLCPGDHIGVSEPVEHAARRCIKSGPRGRECPVFDGICPGRRRPAGELMGHPPVPPLHRRLDRRLDELPPGAPDLPDRDSVGRGRPRGDPATRGARTHPATAVHQALPGGLSPAVPQPALDPAQGLHSGEDRRRSPPGLAVSLAVGQSGGAGCEHPAQDCCEPLDGVVTGAETVHPHDARHPARGNDEAPPTSCRRGSLPGRDRVRCAMLSGSRGAQCACRSEHRTWRC